MMISMIHISNKYHINTIFSHGSECLFLCDFRANADEVILDNFSKKKIIFCVTRSRRPIMTEELLEFARARERIYRSFADIAS